MGGDDLVVCILVLIVVGAVISSTKRFKGEEAAVAAVVPSRSRVTR